MSTKFTEIYGYKIIEKLGSGNEGDVYLVIDSDKKKSVIKVFHKNTSFELMHAHRAGYKSRVVKASARALYCLANGHGKIKSGFYPLEVLQDRDKNIIGIIYPYERLYKISKEIFFSEDSIAQALFCSFCRGQAFLLKNFKLGIADSTLSNYLVTRKGEIRYIDYGVMIVPINDFRCLEEGYLAKSFVDLLMIYSGCQTKCDRMIPLDKPCHLAFDDRLDVIAEKHRWLEKIVREIRHENASIFLDPSFYENIYNRYQPLKVNFRKALYRIIIKEEYKKIKTKLRQN